MEAEDPLTLHATAVQGDPEVMLQCLVQEYAWMGWDTDQILSLFRDPFYPALHQLCRLYGEDGLRTRIAGLLCQMGIYHVQVTVREEPEPAEPGTELIQIGIRSARPEGPKGESHA
jgi:hypothetical protein